MKRTNVVLNEELLSRGKKLTGIKTTNAKVPFVLLLEKKSIQMLVSIKTITEFSFSSFEINHLPTSLYL